MNKSGNVTKDAMDNKNNFEHMTNELNSIIKNQYFFAEDIASLEAPVPETKVERKFYPGTHIPYEKYQQVVRYAEYEESKRWNPKYHDLRDGEVAVTADDCYKHKVDLATKSMFKPASTRKPTLEATMDMIAEETNRRNMIQENRRERAIEERMKAKHSMQQ